MQGNKKMPVHLVVSCSDPRLQATINDYLIRLGIWGHFCPLFTPGGVWSFAQERDRRNTILSDALFLIEKKKISTVHLINHLDCARYAGARPFAGLEEEETRHVEDLQKTRKIFEESFPTGIEFILKLAKQVSPDRFAIL